MDERLLEIREYQGEGYKALVDYGEWRVALLRPSKGTTPADITRVERHNLTDEVFVLLKGSAVLFIGEGSKSLETLFPQSMELGKLYNIKRSAWHTICLSADANVLIVENRDTNEENSEYLTIQPEHKEMIVKIAKKNKQNGNRS
jgi:ureidoglycolate hydrolase